MARLKFKGAADEYSPAFGVTFVAGEAEYPDELAEALLATGRFVEAKVKTPEKGKE